MTTNTADIKSKLEGIRFPVLILSSKAGLGNNAAGAALGEIINDGTMVYHDCIEDLIPDAVRKSEFVRYRAMCERYQWILYCIDKFPANYWIKYAREYLFRDMDLEAIKERISAVGAKTVIVTNNRAAFWVSALLRREEFGFQAWALFTDYCLSQGWRYVFWKHIKRAFGSVSAFEIPFAHIRNKYTFIEMPVSKRFHELSAHPGEKSSVLISGGGWGLGDIFHIVEELYNKTPSLHIHIAVGDNERLYARLKKRFADDRRILIYKDLKSLAPVMEICASVITKPGGITIAEACSAGRKIFLTRGIPGVERKNMRYAVANFGAEKFTFKAFEEWLQRGC